MVLAMRPLCLGSRPGLSQLVLGHNRGLGGESACPAAQWPVTFSEPEERSPSLASLRGRGSREGGTAPLGGSIQPP